MIIKQFFKPTISKIILALTLLIIIFLIYLYNFTYEVCLDFSCNPVIEPIFVLLIIIISYLISCLLISIYNKFKLNIK